MPAAPHNFTVMLVSGVTYCAAGVYSPNGEVHIYQNGYFLKDATCDDTGAFSTTFDLDPGRRKVYMTGSIQGSSAESASSDYVAVHVTGGTVHRDTIKNRAKTPLRIAYWTPAGFVSRMLAKGEAFTLPVGSYCTDLGSASLGHVRLGLLVVYRLHDGETVPRLMTQGIPTLRVRASRPKVVDGFLYVPLSTNPTIVSSLETAALNLLASDVRDVSFSCRPNSRPDHPVTLRVLLKIGSTWYLSTDATSTVITTLFPFNTRNMVPINFALLDTRWNVASFTAGSATAPCSFSEGSQDLTWAQVLAANVAATVNGVGIYTDSTPILIPDGGVLDNVLYDDFTIVDNESATRYHQRFLARWAFDAYTWKDDANGFANPYQYTTWRGDTSGQTLIEHFAIAADSGVGEQRPGEPGHSPMRWPDTRVKFVPGDPTLDNAPSDLSWIHVETYRTLSMPYTAWQIHNPRPDLLLIESAPGRSAPLDVGFIIEAEEAWSGVGIKVINDAGPNVVTVDILFRSVDALFFGAYLRVYLQGTVIRSWEYILDDGAVALQPRHLASRLTSLHGPSNVIDGFVGVYFEYQITGTDDPDYFVMLDIPPGLQLSSTGLLYGYPTVAHDYYACWAIVGNQWGNGSGLVHINIIGNEGLKLEPGDNNFLYQEDGPFTIKLETA